MFGSIGDWQTDAVVYPLLTLDELVVAKMVFPLLGISEDDGVCGAGQDKVRDRKVALLGTPSCPLLGVFVVITDHLTAASVHPDVVEDPGEDKALNDVNAGLQRLPSKARVGRDGLVVKVVNICGQPGSDVEARSW